MSEPESLATVEHLAERLHRHRFDRLIMLSDGIFAISTTLAALEIHIPDRAPDLAAILHESGRQVGIYLLSFFIIAMLWVSNRELFARLKRVDMPVTAAVLALLCMTALIPAVTRQMHGRPDGDFAAYLLTMGMCGTFNSTAWIYAAARRGLMLDEIGRNERWTRALTTLPLVLVTLPFLVIPIERAATVMIPALAVLVLIRRVVLPRMLPTGASPNQAARP